MIFSYPAFNVSTTIIVHNVDLEIGRAGTQNIISHLSRDNAYKVVSVHDQPGRQTFLSTLRIINLKEVDNVFASKDDVLEFFHNAKNHYILFKDSEDIEWVVQVLNTDLEVVFVRVKGRWEIVLNIRRWLKP